MRKTLEVVWEVLVKYEVVPWGVIWLVALILFLTYLYGGER